MFPTLPLVAALFLPPFAHGFFCAAPPQQAQYIFQAQSPATIPISNSTARISVQSTTTHQPPVAMPTYIDPRPGYPPGYRPVRSGFANTINRRVGMGYHKWGFVIYRGTYDDDALWEKFITLLKDNFADSLRHEDQEDVLGPDLVWTIIEDRETLDGASKDAVRARFLEWVAARSVERDGPGADAPWVAKECPRFRYCIYVNRACLDSITARWAGNGIRWVLRGQVVVIDGTHGHHDERPDDPYEDEDEEDVEEEYVPIEGNTSFDVGWRYVDAGTLTSCYEALQFQDTDWGTWEMVYGRTRPSPGGPEVGAGEPLSSLDLSRGEN